eukprot:gene20369-22378_t
MSASEKEGLRSANDDVDDKVYSPPETDIVKSQGTGGLKKNVTLINGIGLIVGSIIGSGIFISPKSVLKNTESIGLSLIIWFLCGFVSFVGALCYSELGTTIPKSGAEYAYLFDAFGPIPAFLFSWTAVLVIRPAAVAGIAVVFGEYVVKPFYDDCDPPIYLIKLLAFICIAIVTIVNCVSVRAAVFLQDAFTYAKLLCIAMLTIIGIVELCKGHTQFFDNSFDGTTGDFSKIGLSFYMGLWAYDGWNTLNYVTEEMKKPARDLPLCLGISMTIVTGCYVLINIAYIAVLGKDGILGSAAVALSVGNAYLGPMKWIVPILVAASTFGAVNGCAFSNGRLAFAAGREGHMPILLAMVQTKKYTPLPSLAFTSFIACLLLIPDASSFEFLVEIFSFASWAFYCCAFLALLFLRWKRPEMNRPFKVPIIAPIFMVIVALFLVVTPFKTSPVGCGVALVCIIAGLPVYYIFVVSKFVPQCWYNGMDTMTKAMQKLCGVALIDNDEDDEKEERAEELQPAI